ncbi:MAG: hypothetical protein ABSB30_15285 [Terracidiphilus sp.]|jgi:hypothetical protein
MMKMFLVTICTLLAMALTVVICGITTFWIYIKWLSIAYPHAYGLAGLGGIVWGFWVGLTCSIIVGAFVIRYFWLKYSSPED